MDFKYAARNGGGFAVVISDSHSALEPRWYWQRGWVFSISSAISISDCAGPDAMYSHREDHGDVVLDPWRSSMESVLTARLIAATPPILS